MINLKNAREIEGLALANEISANTLRIAKEMIRPGVTTEQLDEAMRKYIHSRGAKPDFLGYGGFPKTACISINEEVIHGIPGNRVIREGDIVSVDVGAEIGGWCGDNAYTFMIGEVDPVRKKLCEVTKECLFRGVAQARKGNRLGDIGYAVQSHAEANGLCSSPRLRWPRRRQRYARRSGSSEFRHCRQGIETDPRDGHRN